LTTTSETWFQHSLIKSAVSILNAPGKTIDDVEGTGFLIQYENMTYVVTATHVWEKSPNPMIGHHDKEGIFQQISTEKLANYTHLHWIHHPDELDISIIPFPVQDYMDVKVILESDWNLQTNMKKDDLILHLGHPQGYGASYADGELAFFSVAMPGFYLSESSNGILTYSNGQHGASGGPLFFKRGNQNPQLIGIAYEIDPAPDGGYQNKTWSLPIHHIKKILDSDLMKQQVTKYSNSGV